MPMKTRGGPRRGAYREYEPAKDKAPLAPVTHLQLAPKQAEFSEAVLSGDYQYLLYGGAIRSGKALSLDTPIACPNGWTTMGDLRPSDTVFGGDGLPCHVLMAHPVISEPDSYQLTFSDGSTLEASGDHRWHTYTLTERVAIYKRTAEYRAARRQRRVSRATGLRSPLFTATITERNHRLRPPCLATPIGAIRTTREIAASLIAEGQTNHAIRLAQPLALPETLLPIDPYCLGAWLGDGSSNTGMMCGADPEIFKRFEFAGYRLGPRRRNGAGPCESVRVIGLTEQLDALGVRNNKHIPVAYLRASTGQRLALLQGLMDTDGTVAQKGSVEFTNTNKAIIDGIYELIVSLGWRTTVRESRAMLYGRDCGPVWDLRWSPDEYVFQLERKRRKQRLGTHRTKWRYIIDCRSIPSKPMRCITVDSPDSLFLCGRSMIPSHNSVVALAMAQVLCRVFPGSRWAIVRKDLPTLRRNTIPTWQKVAVPGFAGHVNQSDWTVTCTNGSVIFFFPESIREDPDLDRWKGLEVNGFVLEEANELDRRSWEKAIERSGSWIVPNLTKQPPPLILLTTNPAWGWVKTTFYDPWRVGQLTPPFYYQQATVFDNPYNSPAYLESLKNLPENHYRRFVLGDWGVAAGLAFPEWDDLVHIQPRTEVPTYGVRFVAGMDWGIRAKSCIVLASVDRDENVLCLKEWTWTDRDAYEAGYQWALNLIASELPFPEQLWCDPAMWARVGVGGKTIGDEFQAGISAAIGGWSFPVLPAPRGSGMRAQKFNLIAKKLAWGPRLSNGTLPASKRPAITFWGSECPYLVSSIPALPLDPTDSEDVDTSADDHGYDALGAMLLGLWPAAKLRTELRAPPDVHPGFILGTGIRRARIRSPETDRQEFLISAKAMHLDIGGRYGVRPHDYCPQ